MCQTRTQRELLPRPLHERVSDHLTEQTRTNMSLKNVNGVE